jgi:hypothetical protein
MAKLHAGRRRGSGRVAVAGGNAAAAGVRTDCGRAAGMRAAAAGRHAAAAVGQRGAGAHGGRQTWSSRAGCCQEEGEGRKEKRKKEGIFLEYAFIRFLLLDLPTYHVCRLD